MIRDFGDKATEDLFDGINSREARKIPNVIWGVARRKLAHINVATSLSDLAAIPGSRLEKLRGKMAKFHSIRINDQYRIVFRWSQGFADEVRVTDYH